MPEAVKFAEPQEALDFEKNNNKRTPKAPTDKRSQMKK